MRRKTYAVRIARVGTRDQQHDRNRVMIEAAFANGFYFVLKTRLYYKFYRTEEDGERARLQYVEQHHLDEAAAAALLSGSLLVGRDGDNFDRFIQYVEPKMTISQSTRDRQVRRQVRLNQAAARYARNRRLGRTGVTH